MSCEAEHVSRSWQEYRGARARLHGMLIRQVLRASHWIWLVLCLLGPSAAHAWPGEVSDHGAAGRRGEAETEVDNQEAAEVRATAVRVWLTILEGGSQRRDGVRISPRAAWVEGMAEYSLPRPAREGEVLRLLDFASFLREDPTQLHAAEAAAYVDGPFDAGATVIVDHPGATAMRREGPRRDVVLTLEPGARSVTLRYRVDVPRRPWPFGCVRRQCSLSGALAPLPSVPVRGGRFLDAAGRAVDPVPWTVARAQLGYGPERPEADPRLIVSGGGAGPTAYPSVFWGPRWRRTRTVRDGVEVDVFHRAARPLGRAPKETLIQLRRDLPGHVAAIGSEMAVLLTGIERPMPPGTHVTAVVGPLQSEVVQPHPGTLIVSNQALELLPLERFQKFHLGAIARGWAEVLMYETFVGRHDASTDLWLSGASAFALLDVWQRRREHPDEFASDILRNLTFVPAVDRFLYTQQASFSQTYFRGVEDQPALRNHPLWFAHELPTGRRIHGKLTDTLGPQRLGSFYDAVFRDPSIAPIAAAERAYGYSLDWFFDQWLGRYPEVDVLVRDVTSERASGRRGDPQGRPQTGWTHTIVVGREGPDAVVEPVSVLVTERGGQEHYLLWNGQGNPDAESVSDEPASASHTFVLHTDRRLKSVRVDPRQRLLQTAIEPSNVDPRFNDRAPHQFRFLYTGAGISVAASEAFTSATPAARFNAISGFAAFEASLRRDLRRTGHLLIARDRESIVAVGSGINLWWGRKANPQRRVGRVRMFVTGGLLSDRSLDEASGVRLTERVAVIHDTRRFSWWPHRGRRLSLGVMARQTLREDELGGADHRADVAADALWVQIWPVAHDHTIATSLGAEMVVPMRGRPEFRSLARVGGIGGLTGYAADEVFGLALATARAEYRHVFVRNMHANLGHLSYVRSLGGVAFVGGASSSGCESYAGWFGKDSLYAHVGYGLTMRTSVLGVTPQLLRLEASVPLVRRRGVQCLDKTLPDFLAERQGLESAQGLLPPFNVNVLFNQPF